MHYDRTNYLGELKTMTHATCPQCGVQIGPDATRCLNCGQTFASQGEHATAPPPILKMMGMLLLAVGAALFITPIHPIIAGAVVAAGLLAFVVPRMR